MSYYGHPVVRFQDPSDLRKRQACRRFVSNYGLVPGPHSGRTVGQTRRLSSGFAGWMPDAPGRWQGESAVRAGRSAVLRVDRGQKGMRGSRGRAAAVRRGSLKSEGVQQQDAVR
jgi:hypothetical protein